MSLISMSVEHHSNLVDARQRLSLAVQDVRTKFASAIRSEEWSPDRSTVTLQGPGVLINLRVDDSHVHATGDIPLLNTLLGSTIGKAITGGLKNALGRHFKALPGATPTATPAVRSPTNK